MKINRKRTVLWLLSVMIGIQIRAKPNVLLIFVDDMGYADLSCYGGELTPTPNIDSLARDGVRFTDGYATSSVCAPSRCALLSGAYNQRFGMQWNEDQYDGAGYTYPENHKLMPEFFAANGYITGHTGKWNVRRDAKKVFHETSHEMNWKGHYFQDAQDGFLGVDGHGGNAINDDELHAWSPDDQNKPYLTDVLTDNAIGFIERHSAEKRPFFYYLAYNAVHTPLQARMTKEFDHLPNEPLRIYAAMVQSLDQNVGRLLEALRKCGITDNTIVAFASDNGPAMGNPNIKGWHSEWPERVLLGSSAPLKGHKAQYYEGGVRIPYILRWPGVLRAGTIYSHPVSTMDFYPTFCAAAKIEIPESTMLDGVNLLPYLNDQKQGSPHEYLFWKHNNLGAVRRGKWKLVITTWQPKIALYDLDKDIGESVNLAKESAEITETLRRAWEDWSADLPPRANPPQETTQGTLTGVFQPTTVQTQKEGKPFSAWMVIDDQGQEHITYYRQLKAKMVHKEIKALEGKRVRITGRRVFSQKRSYFESIEVIEEL